VPPKADPRDWDRYFRPGAPRRSGPLRALANIILICVAFGILGGASLFAWNFGRERARQSAAANASIVETSNAAVIATKTTRAQVAAGATATAAVASLAVTPTASPEVLVGRGSVTNGGNLRNEPRVADETVIGQICAGDKIDFLEERTLSDGALWYRIRLIEAAGTCTSQRVTVGSIGWASATLLTKPTP
jgi:hypothetical protein